MRNQRDDSGLRRDRATAQRAREADLMAYFEGSRPLDRGALIREIRDQLRIINDNQIALAQATTSAADQAAIERQIEIRIAKVKSLIDYGKERTT